MVRPDYGATQVERLRVEAHLLLDQIWKRKKPRYTRSEAYIWLSKVLHKKKRDAHISRLNASELERTIRLIRSYADKMQITINENKTSKG